MEFDVSHDMTKYVDFSKENQMQIVILIITYQGSLAKPLVIVMPLIFLAARII